jgi:hypothetical protein
MRSEPALAVTVDSQDNVVAVGHTTVDILAIKWDANGNQQWLRTLDGSAGNIDQALAVAVDSQDRVIASGFTTNTDTGQGFTVMWLCTNCP